MSNRKRSISKTIFALAVVMSAGVAQAGDPGEIIAVNPPEITVRFEETGGLEVGKILIIQWDAGGELIETGRANITEVTDKTAKAEITKGVADISLQVSIAGDEGASEAVEGAAQAAQTSVNEDAGTDAAAEETRTAQQTEPSAKSEVAAEAVAEVQVPATDAQASVDDSEEKHVETEEVADTLTTSEPDTQQEEVVVAETQPEPELGQASSAETQEAESDNGELASTVAQEPVSGKESNEESSEAAPVVNETPESAAAEVVVDDDRKSEQVVDDDDDAKQETVADVSQDVSTEKEEAEQEAPQQTEPTVAEDGIICKKICREDATGKPLRVLARAFSNIYKEQSDAEIAFENVPAFKPFYVEKRVSLDLSNPAEPKGWYAVRDAVKSETMGWMKAADVLEWRQALIVAYTHPGDDEETQRQRVLMFSEIAKLKEIVDSDNSEIEAVKLYQALRDGEVPSGVVSKEPESFISITDNFYILPIVDFEQTDLNGEAATYLKIAAAVPGKRGSDTLDKQETRAALMNDPVLKAEQAKNLGIDVVFVMDMTASMQPYIDATKDAIKQLAGEIVKKHGGELKEKIRFGLVGFRDNTEVVPALEFASKNFTPNLVDSAGLAKLLDADAKAAIVSSKGYAEDVFAGVAMALNETAWSQDSLKVMILVGDASGHAQGENMATTQHGSESLREIARDRHIHPIALHLKDNKHLDDHVIAEEQYKSLSQVEGDRYTSAYIDVKTEDQGAFVSQITKIAARIEERLSQLRIGAGEDVGKLMAKAKESGESDANGESGESGSGAFDRAFNAALIEYLGREAEPPKDFTAWVIDRDLTDPSIEALDVRVMVSREQLSDLATALKQIHQARKRAEVTSQEFFTALQAVAAQTAKDPERIGKASTLADAGLLPAFISSLPYKSSILAMSEEQFASLSEGEGIKLDKGLLERVAYYEAVNSNTDGWITLNEEGGEDDTVYPLSLNMLP